MRTPIVESPERYKRKQEGCEEDYGYIACDVASDVCNLFHIYPESSIKFVENKPFKDQRYFLDAEKLKCLGWSERTTWQEGLNETTDWYTSNPDWWVDVSGALFCQPRMLMMLDEVGEVIDVPKNYNTPI
ncbi:trifunctional UDP-glucose 4,6-dehydratase/UDP-4-keto-6-deoxy-D-glucose 3,5-epimerase/UDP-4-keto-L-rhamnose-reductase RHM1 [Tanacetum coccineum]